MTRWKTLFHDPRRLVIEDRLKGVERVVPVMSPKGGVGKTVVSVLIALALVDEGLKVGVLDLDVTNPSIHLALGVDTQLRPSEERGVIPPDVRGVKVMTVAYYSSGNPLPLRGAELVDVVREVLAITVWGVLDYLIVDTPPGMSDVFMEVLNNVRRAEPLVVTTPSVLSLNPVKSLLKILGEVGIPILGVVENMSDRSSEHVVSLCREHGVRYLGNIPLDPLLNVSLGDVYKIRETQAYGRVKELLRTQRLPHYA
ncbi:MAG: Mrp/NBP35 family ATP-binding protein [Zestosphaera sp.]